MENEHEPAIDQEEVSVSRSLTEEQKRTLSAYLRDPEFQRTARRRARLLVKGKEEDVEDLLQEAFKKATQGFYSFAAPKEGFGGWFNRILTNTLLDRIRLRKHRITERLLEDHDARVIEQKTFSTPEGEYQSREWIAALSSAIEQLPTTHQDVARLRYIENMDGYEIAATLRIPYNTVLTRLFHLRSKICAILLEQFPDINEAIQGRTSSRSTRVKTYPPKTKRDAP